MNGCSHERLALGRAHVVTHTAVTGTSRADQSGENGSHDDVHDCCDGVSARGVWDAGRKNGSPNTSAVGSHGEGPRSGRAYVRVAVARKRG